MFIITAIGTGGVFTGLQQIGSMNRAVFITCVDTDEVKQKRKEFSSKAEANRFIKENNLQMCEVTKV